MSERMFAFLSRNHSKNGDTWNPLGGECLHKCKYCWINQLKKIFPNLREKYSSAPRIYPKELDRIKEFTAKDFVFACDCNDLFGHWVPTELIQQILNAIAKSPAKFLLLTKNPQRYRQLISIGIPIPLNCILGCTVESDIDHLLSGQPEEQRLKIMSELKAMGYPVMLSIEPIMEFNIDCLVSAIYEIGPEFVAVGYDSGYNNLDEPSLAKTEELIGELEAAGIKVYRKLMREASINSKGAVQA